MAPESNPGLSQGLLIDATRLLGSFLRHLEALSGLVGVESREAGQRAAKFVVALIAAAFFAVFAYIFALLFIVSVLALVLRVWWVWTTLGICVLHVLAVLGCAFYARNQTGVKWFPATSEAIRRDIAALQGTAHGSAVPVVVPKS